MSSTFCSAEEWRLVGPCAEEVAMAIFPTTLLLVVGIIYWRNLRKFQGEVGGNDPYSPVHTCGAIVANRNYARRGCTDVTLLWVGGFTAIYPLIVIWMRKAWPDSLHAAADHNIFFAIVHCVAWLFACSLVWMKSRSTRALPTTWHLRVFWLLAFLFAILRLRALLVNTINDSGVGDSPEFDTITWGIFTVLVSVVTFAGVCFRGGYPYDSQILQGTGAYGSGGDATASSSSDKDKATVAASPDSSPAAIDLDKLDSLRNKLVATRVGDDVSSGRCRACEGNKWSPEAHLGWFSRLTFIWMNPLMRAGNDHQLKLDELINVRQEDSAASVDESFQRSWEQVQSEGNPSFPRALYRSFGGTFIFAGFLKLIYDTVVFVSPQLLSAITNYLDITRNHEPWYYGLYYVAAMVGSAIFQTLVLHQYFHGVMRTGMRFRTAVVTAIYRKSLRLSTSARQSKSTGEIVNLMSTDASRLQELCSYLHVIWSGPYQITLSIYFLYQQLGPSVFAGLAVMLCMMIPANAVMARKVKAVQTQLMKIRDMRVKITNETLQSMKIIKLYAWEKSFGQKIENIRDAEIAQLRRYLMVSMWMTMLWRAIPIIVALVTFGAYTLSDNDLTASKAFTSLALFEILQFPLTMFPRVITNTVEARVSAKRIESFLLSAEIPGAKEQQSQLYSERPASVEVSNGNFFWDDLNTKRALHNINMTVHKGHLCVIIGETGSGKSALLSALIGDLRGPPETNLTVRGTVAYTSQTAWIRNATVRDNICFGKPYNKKWYDDVVEACSLAADFKILPAGDLTEIGAKGINLSGGQKQRVALARAVYQNADVYMLDDTLSAVDAHVGLHIVNECLLGLLKTKTRLLVTHNINILPHADCIVLMERGTVRAFGTYQKLVEMGIDFTKVIPEKKESKEEKKKGDAPAKKVDDKKKEAPLIPATTKVFSFNYKNAFGEIDDEERAVGVIQPSSLITISDNYGQLGDEKKSGGKKGEKTSLLSSGGATPDKATPKIGALVEEEGRQVGSVSYKVYQSYFTAAGGQWVAFVIIFTMSLTMVANIATSNWLAYWSNNSEGESEDIAYYLGVYAALSFSSIITLVVALVVLMSGGLRAATKMHESLLRALLRTPMWVYDTTPIGRILNRFSKETNTVDETLFYTLSSYLLTMLRVVGVVIVISYVTPWFLLAMAPVAAFYYYTQNYYIKTSRELQRWESVLRSPIFSHFSETLEGTTSIRAFGMEEQFIAENSDKMDKNLRAYYPNIASNRWLALRLETVGTFIITFAALLVVFRRDSIDPGMGALSLSYALSITQSLNWMVRMNSERETNIVSVERIKEYTELPRESPLVEAIRPTPNWPQEGRIVFKNLKLKYRPELDLVLKGLSCEIKPKEKIGVVGRTGAGKSSMLIALLRLVEPVEGTIEIDGIDIRKIGLHDLRSRLSIIPQDPVLFTGTVRSNLDPFVEHSDDEVWQSLQHCHLARYVRTLDDGLNAEVTEGGSNFSMGQRQLLCLGRALLRKSKILLLDEATSAIDMETDKLVQETIREAFADCTTLTIAHRLETILQSSRVMVLGNGGIQEFDAPDVLRANPDSAFSAILASSAIGHGGVKASGSIDDLTSPTKLQLQQLVQPPNK